jgi:iron complex outermembrane receptor protein
MFYLGSRSNDGYLAIPIAQQNGVRNSGGVSVLDRTFGGVGLRWTRQDSVTAMPFTVTSGVDYDQSTEDRQGFVNAFGVQGASKRDETNGVVSIGAYVQAELQATEKFSVSAGIRYTSVRFDSDDDFICTNTVNTTGTPLGTCSGTTSAVTASPNTWNPDDSGSVDYGEWTPVLGALYKLTPSLNLYANIGQSFETPTFIELAYRSDGGSGLNFSLEPATSLAYEVGAKAFLGPSSRVNFALFQIRTDNEIVVASNAGGRSTFTNAPDTERTGVELWLDSSFGGGFTGAISATYIDAEFKDSYYTCTAAPCTTPNVLVAAGNKIPGVPPYSVYATLGWSYAPIGFDTGIELRWLGEMYANDTNTESADSYFVAALRAGLTRQYGRWTVQAFGRIDNLFNAEYIGAVAVNDANGRFYFPAPTRSWLAGANVSYAFR